MSDHIVEQLDEAFLDHLQALADYTTAGFGATCLEAQRQWYMPPLNGWSGNPLDIPETTLAFDRDALNAVYIAVVSDDAQRGRIGAASVLKLQIDYIAALERSFRTRHATSVRCRIHAGGRRRGHGASGGLFDTGNGNIALWLNRMLSAANTDD